MDNQIRAYGSLTISNFKMYLRNPIASSSLLLALLVLLFVFKIVFDSPGPHTKLVVVDASNGAAAVLIRDLRSVSVMCVSVRAGDATDNQKLPSATSTQ